MTEVEPVDGKAGRGRTSGCERCDDGAFQPYPVRGPLARNMNLDGDALSERIQAMNGAVYVYVVRTVKWQEGRLVHEGSAPNFQGGYITLCTCKWQMRAGREVQDWEGVWIAGITGNGIGAPGQHLVYLTRVVCAYESHRDLWHTLPAQVREAKAADSHKFGDIYRPQDLTADPYSSLAYREPVKSHPHAPNNAWHKDVNYAAYARRPALLVGDPSLSFLWDQPIISSPFRLGRGCKIMSLETLLGTLRGTAS